MAGALPTELSVLPITNSETMMHFYRNNNVFEIVTIKSILSNFKQLFDIMMKISYTCGMCYIKGNSLKRTKAHLINFTQNDLKSSMNTVDWKSVKHNNR